jgi:hypothetical protein
MVDALGVLEAAGLLGQSGGEVFGVAGLGCSVTDAERAVRVDDGRAALATGGGTILTTLGSEV